MVIFGSVGARVFYHSFVFFLELLYVGGIATYLHTRRRSQDLRWSCDYSREYTFPTFSTIRSPQFVRAFAILARLLVPKQFDWFWLDERCQSWLGSESTMVFKLISVHPFVRRYCLLFSCKSVAQRKCIYISGSIEVVSWRSDSSYSGMHQRGYVKSLTVFILIDL